MIFRFISRRKENEYRIIRSVDNIRERKRHQQKRHSTDAVKFSEIKVHAKNHFGKADNIKVIMDRLRPALSVDQEKTVVDEVMDDYRRSSLEDAKNIIKKYEISDIVQIP